MPPSALPQEGAKAPAFNLPANTGEKIRLSSLSGRKVVVYFYPKDNTPGCTTEAQEFRDAATQFEKLDCVILGVSPDPVDSHGKFVDKYNLNFTLLSDEDHAVAEKYGVWVKKNMYGREYWGVQRATFLIDENGKVVKVWPKVKPKGHAKEVLETIRKL